MELIWQYTIGIKIPRGIPFACLRVIKGTEALQNQDDNIHFSQWDEITGRMINMKKCKVLLWSPSSSLDFIR